eukprot:CAMPEP_0202873850 /NCGR_PEP_ID=MMETSP1391-20130828/24157_1 /ASSEMBLY_ACC=CAM_ASM_000867 /TAXON_ID=1034604 /ORGANISM="Chlamydomonas leiostraca, Strain SAG 11-49" /LENGTH=84 /DNA_ID=CAMNT_0049555157 /DNA_START=88 /DNA_END=342 /DNA_ORIENTATION=-
MALSSHRCSLLLIMMMATAMESARDMATTKVMAAASQLGVHPRLSLTAITHLLCMTRISTNNGSSPTEPPQLAMVRFSPVTGSM